MIEFLVSLPPKPEQLVMPRYTISDFVQTKICLYVPVNLGLPLVMVVRLMILY